jgi:hypothetical protein
MTTLIQGKAYWCKIIGRPHDNKFNPGVKQWSFDLGNIDKATQKQLLEMGMKKTSLRNKSDERETFISFQKNASKADGEPTAPFRIVDQNNQPWPKDKLIGNGSTLNVSVMLSERLFRGEKFLKPVALAIQVWDYVEYERPAEFPSKPPEDTEAPAQETGETVKEW